MRSPPPDKLATAAYHSSLTGLELRCNGVAPNNKCCPRLPPNPARSLSRPLAQAAATDAVRSAEAQRFRPSTERPHAGFARSRSKIPPSTRHWRPAHGGGKGAHVCHTDGRARSNACSLRGGRRTRGSIRHRPAPTATRVVTESRHYAHRRRPWTVRTSPL